MHNNSIIRDMIYQSKGRFFTVIFKKLDGSLRKMNCRIGVHKGIKDPFGLHKMNHDWNRITVWDVPNKGYRSFYISNIKELSINGFRLVDYWD